MRRSVSFYSGPFRLAVRLALAAILFTARGAPAQTVTHISTADCASCHQAETALQPHTFMGRALELPGANSVVQNHPLLTLTQGAYTWTIRTRDGHTTYSVTDGIHTMTVPVVWSFGVANQTWVLEHDGHFYESIVSYYPSVHGLAITTGDASIKLTSIEEAFGRRLDPTDARTCFGCHASHDVFDNKLILTQVHPGVSCAHCHVGALQHFNSMVSGDLTVFPPDLSHLDTQGVSDFCGRCHRSFETVVRAHWSGESTVRFQPFRLELSQCYDGSDPRISCLACHDPHKPLVRKLTWYDSKCLACHTVDPHARNITDAQAEAASKALAADIAAATPKRLGGTAPNPPASAPSLTDVADTVPAPRGKPLSCPVAKSHCVSCHMPLTQMLGGPLWFYDHYIRIARPGQPYPY